MLKKFLCMALAAFMLLSVSARTASTAELVEVPTAWLDEHETFLMWYAVEKGWDVEAGLKIKMQLFSSGADILNALPSGKWVYAGMGAVPAMLGNLRYGTTIIALGNDESRCNVVLVRPDSPIAKVKGWNKEHPNVLGSPETVRGKTFLVTTVSSAHYALSAWLETLGLTDSDIAIKNMDQAQALAAFENNIGDGVGLWAPHMFVAMDKGAVLAADMKMLGKGNPIVLVADTRYAEKQPDVTARFLSVYLRAVKMFKETSPEMLVSEYQRFHREFVGKDYDATLALKDLQYHPVFDLQQQLSLFDDSKGPSQVQKWQADIAAYFSSIGRITAEEAKKVADGKYATNAYLKLVK